MGSFDLKNAMITLLQILYHSILTTLFIISLPVLPLLYLFSEKRRANLLYRFGVHHLISRKPSGVNRIWVHALSVGEAKSAIPLIQRFNDRLCKNGPIKSSKLTQYESPEIIGDACVQTHTNALAGILSSVNLDSSSPGNSIQVDGNVNSCEIIMTVSTWTGFQVAQESLNSMDGAPISLGYFPYDLIFSVKRICRRIDPDVVIIVESDLWPNFLWHLSQKQVPIFLVNARLSMRSLKGYLKGKLIFSHLFSHFTTIMAQTDEDKRRFRMIGVADERIEVTGNIKFDQPVPKVDDCLASLLGNRPDSPLLLAGSTHPGEEKILAGLYYQLKERYPTLRMMIAPRDIQRAPEIIQIFQLFALHHGRMEVKTVPPIYQADAIFSLSTASHDELTQCDIIVVDTMGILAGLYAICDIAFVGGSLLPFGGHNPLEPALFSKPVIFGPHMTDFLEPAALLVDGGTAFQVSDESELFQIVQWFLENPEKAAVAGKKGGALFASGRGAIQRVEAIIKKHMNRFDL